MTFKQTMFAIAILLVGLTLPINGEPKDFATLDHIKSHTSLPTQKAAVEDLIKRLVPDKAAKFVVNIDPTIGPPKKDTFRLVSAGSSLQISGTSGLAAAWGFYHYLSQYCGCHISWAGDQVSLPAELPVIASAVTVTSNDRFRYYQNVCTVSYSFAWWNWTRWEKEIDWMAMNGINLPLAFNGQEAIWQRVLLKMGFTEAEIDNHLGGPAFLAWTRMGNIHGWGGPLPKAWHDQQVALQHKILNRMRALGMTPILPAFNGAVPNGIIRLFPKAKVSHLSKWGRFSKEYCCTLLLDLSDPLFTFIGKSFLTEYIEEFGTDHVYNTDTFNEMTPKSSKVSYLHAAGKAVFHAMTAADPQAIWVMQGWLFIAPFWKPPQAKALLTSVPLGRMIILDLFSEARPQYSRLKSFYGQPFIWCMLHNFGGTMAWYGVIDTINKGPFAGRAFANSTMIGIGLTPEGINQNDVMYEFMLENSWRTKPRNLTKWINDYATRRYGQPSQSADRAWQIFKSGVYNYSLKKIFEDHSHDVITVWAPRLQPPMNDIGGVYNCTDGGGGTGGMILTPSPQLLPPMNPNRGVYNCTAGKCSYWDFSVDVIPVRLPTLIMNPAVWYDANEFFRGWDLMIQAAEKLDSKLFRYDLVDATRQSLQLTAIVYYHKMIGAYKNHSIGEMVSSGKELLDLLTDMEELLATDSHFLLGNWIESAKALGTSQKEKALYEYNARTQVTIWGPNANILDYANKQWSGLFQDYYRPRWELFILTMTKSMLNNVSFDQNQYNADVFKQVEEPFTKQTKLYPTHTTGDQVEVARAIHGKYRPVIVHHAKFFRELPERSQRANERQSDAGAWSDTRNLGDDNWWAWYKYGQKPKWRHSANHTPKFFQRL